MVEKWLASRYVVKAKPSKVVQKRLASRYVVKAKPGKDRARARAQTIFFEPSIFIQPSQFFLHIGNGMKCDQIAKRSFIQFLALLADFWLAYDGFKKM